MALAVVNRTVVDDTGAVIPYASVEVRTVTDNSLASLYSDSGSQAPIANPITSDSRGLFKFYVTPGTYTIEAGNGVSSIIWTMDVFNGDSQTLDGFDSSDFAQLSGATYTGQVTHTSGVTVQLEPGLDIDVGASGAVDSLEIYQGTAGADALIAFHVVGDFATYFGVDGGLNDFVIGGWSHGASTKYRIWHEANNDLVGQVAYFAMSTAPSGWIKANGAAISRATYANLFSKIGATYGAGDGTTTFDLPDLRGEFMRGLDDGRGVDSGRGLGSHQPEQIGHHAHVLRSMTNGDYANYGSGGALNGWGVGTTTPNAGDARLQAGDESSASFNIGTGGETRPRNHALLACIKY